MATVTYSGLTQEQKTFYDRNLNERLKPNLVWAKFGQKRPLPKHEGDTINFRKFNALTPATTALTEGTAPDGSSITVSAVTATLAEYGDFVKYTEKINTLGIDPFLAETSEVLGEQAAQTVDKIICDKVSTGTNVLYANGKSSTATVAETDVLTVDDVKNAVKILRDANAKPIDGRYYIGIIDPTQERQIMDDTDWVNADQYSGATRLMNGEVGKIAGVRFITTTQTKVKAASGASSCDVHCCMILGKDAFGISDVEGSGSPKMIYHAKGEVGNDPLDQVGTVGWKVMFTVARLEELAMVRLETGAPA